MPLTPDMIALIGSGTNAASSIAGGLGTLYANNQNQSFSREMLARTQAINLSNWVMQNEYNSPEAQMARLQKAGLNPNLALGSMGNNSASSLPAPSAPSGQSRAPDFGDFNFLSGLLQAADLKIKDAQATNLNEQTDNIKLEKDIKAWQAKKLGFDYDFDVETRGLAIDAMSESNRQKRVGTDLSINADARAAIANTTSVAEAAERILNLIESRKGMPGQRSQVAADTRRIEENIRQMQKDGTLKDWEIMLNKSNVSKSDALWQRWVADLLLGDKNLFKSIESIPKGTKFHHKPND